MTQAYFESKVDRYDRAYRMIRGRTKPEEVLYTDSSARILSRSRGFLGGFDYTMQLQVGCPGGCLFCYVSSAPRLAPADVRQRWGFEVRVKKDIPSQLARHLSRGELADRTVYWSGVTDPYAIRRSVTQAVWQTFNAVPTELRPRRIVIQSRYRPARDRDLIAEYANTTTASDGGPSVVISFSIGTDRNDLIHSWERATPTFEQRMTSIKKLRERGIFVIPTLSPFGVWNDLELALVQFRDLGVSFITVLFLKKKTPTANTPPDFLKHVAESYPFLLEPKWQQEQLRKMRERVGQDRVLAGQKGFSSLVNPPLTDPIPE
ncbi:MAG: hypothetical protein JSU96_20625 [Acidobacteriota bacterium]|nr:MAG: hypothetical protein JSU96_20625 [Acidobacteriota bacterium]